MKHVDLSGLESRIGYDFQEKGLLLLAMTHSSYANEHKGKNSKNNERLEFLGDAVLEITVSDYLFHTYPSYDEGKMTKTRSSMVCEFTLASCAREIELGQYLRLSNGEDFTGGRERDSILSDAFEALIGAIYLDGGMEHASAFIHHHLLQDIGDKTLFYDAKTILQEMVQSSNNGALRYELIGETGPDHNKEFTVETYIGDKVYASGSGRTKKGAEQMAAYQTILMLKK
ncbi:MAG: ribonuclease III [Eubacteriales bacterium]|nr:ribonuclease III [Eubacteriales bacterium]